MRAYKNFLHSEGFKPSEVTYLNEKGLLDYNLDFFVSLLRKRNKHLYTAVAKRFNLVAIRRKIEKEQFKIKQKKTLTLEKLQNKIIKARKNKRGSKKTNEQWKYFL